MRKSKQRKLARAGWKVGTARDFLGLSSDEHYLVELRLLEPVDVRSRELGLEPSRKVRRLPGK